MSKKFIVIDRSQPIIVPGNCEGWLKDNHLARFIVEIVEAMDTKALEDDYRGGGSNPYPPKMMLALLFYSYATGTFSSRKIEQATYELIPVMYIAGGEHPDHDTINTFRKRFLSKLGSLFLQILMIAHGMGYLKLGDVSLDGTKIQANASKHKAMSWEYANKLEAQLKGEIEELLKRAESENSKNGGINIPAELERREARLAKIAEVKAEIERRAQARYEQEQAEYEAKLKARQEKEATLGRKLGGKKPQAPEPGPRAKDQVNFTDEESRIMPTSGGGFEQAYNAQASVDMDSRLIIGQHVSQNPNDKQEIAPALDELDKLPEEVGKVQRMATDNGYHSESNAKKVEQKGIEAYMADSRQNHNPTLEERFAPPPEAPEQPNTMEAMRYRMKTEEGKAFYARRKSTVEPVFGVIKEVMGFRRFMLRGLEAVKGEWTLICMAFNLKRLCALSA
jgi:transposase